MHHHGISFNRQDVFLHDPPRLYIPAPGCPDPRFRAVIMTNEWQKQPRSLKQCGLRHVLG